MRIWSLPRRAAWRIGRALGGRFSQWAWDDQYRRGRCSDLVEKRDPVTVSLVQRLAAGGSIVELGCGAATLVAALPPECYSSYLGIDLSEVAILLARRRAHERGLTNCRFEVGDMSVWAGDRDVSLIVLEEALMYLTPTQQRALLHRCNDSLRPGGRILVTAHSAAKHHETLMICRQTCPVVEELAGARVHLVLGRIKSD